MSEAVRKVIIKKVKKNHGGGHHGGSWKVAYADFVTAMMAFFLLLWLLSMVSEDKRIATAEYFKNFSIFKESGKTFQPGSAFVITDHIKKAEMKPENLATALKKAIKNKSNSDQVLIDVIEGGVRVQIIDKEGSPMFQLGSAEPTTKAKEILSLVYEEIKDLGGKIAIEGHTDAAPFRGDQITNWELSTMRASATRRLLETNGLDPTRVARVVGYADTELLIKDQPKDPQNRRISIIMMQPKEGGSPSAEPLTKDIRTSFQDQTAQPGQQAQPGTSGPAIDSAASKENAAKQAFQHKKAEMKKKKRDVMGLWE
ncbi:MAG TPA: flagellar motor protein MotB [Syntrophales bacterium]|nr:flagellar motor protein MotB [Syntrophales bacterium]